MRAAGIERVDPSSVAPFNYRRLGERYLVTSVSGQWLVLSAADFRAFVEGELPAEGPAATSLAQRGLLSAALDTSRAASRLRGLQQALTTGPRLHTLISTSGDTHMSVETAERAIDCAFMTTSPEVHLVIAGDAPFDNEDTLHRVVAYANNKNRLAGKSVVTTVRTSADSITSVRAAWMAQNGVGLLAVADADTLLEGSAGQVGLAAYAGAAPTRPATLEVTLDGALLDQAEAIVALAAETGCASVLARRPRAQRSLLGDDAGVVASVTDWLASYTALLDAAIATGGSEHQVVEAGAAAYLRRILSGTTEITDSARAGVPDGVGQLAYHCDGRVFSSDEGRQVADLGDDLFQLGELRYHGYHDIVTHSTVRALLLAGVLEGQPDCVACAYKPFCGQVPAENYAEQGSIHGRMRDSDFCREVKSVQDLLFTRLEGPTGDTLRGWV